MQPNKKNILIIITHIIFWTGVCYFFTHYSFLRPVAAGAIYKELLCVLLIAIMVYLNYFCFIPKFFQSGKFVLYWTVAILSIFVAGFGEYFLLKPHISICFANSFSYEEIKGILRVSFGLITLRDFGFFMFFFVLRLYNDLFKRTILEKQALTKQTNYVSIISSKSGSVITVMLDDIVYISQKRNYTTFHLTNGNKCEQYSSLANVEQTFPGNTCLRINKNSMAIISHIIDYDTSSVTINMKNAGKNITLNISQRYRDNILEVLNKNVKISSSVIQKFGNKKTKKGGVTVWTKDENNEEIGTNNGVISTQNDSNIVEKASKINNSNEEKLNNEVNIELDITSKTVLDFIKNYNENPHNINKGCRVPIIADGVNFAPSTIETHIKILKDYGLIEFRGAPRNGGYYLIDDE
ncbi:LytTR family transcriptional regulator DNA-binding domain-containing protein [Odoribacter sp. OttesenSCG-928-L07]|nr:LytTR family transcriptional regulator DNA-binding domain-containing protein [Odoribacter sp. OttesenSCG-928-L07]MDL2239478.1 LytTR family transcriptional regulator DNA-binding domain-containing protein [Bacteroidales bacterium OttesenSCG-928-L14]MDL2240697.1 LytTR family transcriptional regulator DNA-binding domain-containing protein [Bacteroidales bacterium OttesenSCG-928-K22]